MVQTRDRIGMGEIQRSKISYIYLCAEYFKESPTVHFIQNVIDGTNLINEWYLEFKLNCFENDLPFHCFTTCFHKILFILNYLYFYIINSKRTRNQRFLKIEIF